MVGPFIDLPNSMLKGRIKGIYLLGRVLRPMNLQFDVLCEMLDETRV